DMRIPAILVAGAAALFFVGCESGGSKGSCVEKSECSYRNTFDFVWESANAELKDSWKIASEDKCKRTITTCWKTETSPYSAFGRRDRLIVTFVGDGNCGWRASANQECQTNTNEEDPLDTKKAKWSEAPSDGALAAKFLQNLDTRLQPDERWRNQLTR